MFVRASSLTPRCIGQRGTLLNNGRSKQASLPNSRPTATCHGPCVAQQHMHKAVPGTSSTHSQHAATVPHALGEYHRAFWVSQYFQKSCFPTMAYCNFCDMSQFTTPPPPPPRVGNFMHAGALDYAMHNYARLCGLHCNEDTQGLQTRGNLGLRSPTNRQHSEICSSHSCLFRSENHLALPHFQTVEEFHRPAKHLQQWKHVQVHFAGQNCP